MVDVNDVNDVNAAPCPHGELAVGWALHALEPAEESLFAAHLVDCPACTRTVSETERIGASLGLSIPQLAPDARLEQRVLAVVNATAVAPVIPLRRPPNPEAGTGLRRIGKALVSVAAVVLLGASMVLGARVVQLGGERDQAMGQITQLSELIQRSVDPASVRVPLINEEGQPIGMVLAARDHVALVSTGLPGNRTADEMYVLWGLGYGAPMALAGFDVAPDAPPALYPVRSVPDAGEFTGYAVSLEHGRHTPAAPTTVKASGKVES